MSWIFSKAGKKVESTEKLLTDIVNTTNQDMKKPLDIKSANFEGTKILKEAECYSR